MNKISYSRRANQPLLCVQCHKLAREHLKQSQRDEEIERQAHYAKMQEECFIKASQAMQEELKNQEEPISNIRPLNEHEECVRQEQEVNTRAKQEAENLLKKEDNIYENLQMEQAYLVFKFLFISEELMVKGLLGMPHEAWSQWYRGMAKQLHPDKNCHPNAKEAF